MSITTTTTVEPSSDPLDASRWTTPQELCLLQSLTHYKPVGIHKHFRMVAILNALLASGTIPQPVTDHPHVSTTEGVWRKLGSLYDLKSLDEREDAIFADIDDVEYWREFELNDHDFGGKMWERRLADEEDEDWSAEEEAADVTMRESTIADGDDPRMSPAGSVKGTRASGRRAADRRLAEVKQQETAAGSGRASRRTSKAASPSVKAEEDTEMQDAGDGEEASGEEDDESGQDETEDDSRKGGRHTRRGTRRGGRTRRTRRTK